MDIMFRITRLWITTCSSRSTSTRTPRTGTALAAPGRATFVDALHAWENVANIIFLEVSDVNAANVVLRKVPAVPNLGDADGAANTPDQSAHILYLKTPLSSFQPDGYTFEVALHEIGHMLGLAHPHDRDMATGVFPGLDGLGENGQPADFNFDGTVSNPPNLQDISFDPGNNNLNSIPYTVMTYNTFVPAANLFGGSRPRLWHLISPQFRRCTG